MKSFIGGAFETKLKLILYQVLLSSSIVSIKVNWWISEQQSWLIFKQINIVITR